MRRLLAAAAVAAALGGCGAPDELSNEDAKKLANAREGVENAVETAESMRSPAKLRRTRREIRRLVATGSFEADVLDEFGLAALGELQQVLPSVVETDADGVPLDLDRPGLRAFLRYAATDPRRALRGPVTEEVETIEKVISDSDADEETKVGDETVEQYLAGVERDLRPLYPALADRVSDLP